MLLIVLLVALVVLDLAAVRWGVDSGEKFDSLEWERRKNWPGYGRL